MVEIALILDFFTSADFIKKLNGKEIHGWELFDFESWGTRLTLFIVKRLNWTWHSSLLDWVTITRLFSALLPLQLSNIILLSAVRKSVNSLWLWSSRIWIRNLYSQKWCLQLWSCYVRTFNRSDVLWQVKMQNQIVFKTACPF